jgi:hypothetical protein
MKEGKEKRQNGENVLSNPRRIAQTLVAHSPRLSARTDARRCTKSVLDYRAVKNKTPRVQVEVGKGRSQSRRRSQHLCFVTVKVFRAEVDFESAAKCLRVSKFAWHETSTLLTTGTLAADPRLLEGGDLLPYGFASRHSACRVIILDTVLRTQ